MLHHKTLVNQGFFFFTFLLKHNNYLPMAEKFKHFCQYPILQNSCFGACIFEVFSFYWCHSRFSFKRQDFFVLIALADIALPLFVAEEIKIKVVLKIISLFVCYNPEISFLSNLCQYPAEVFSYAPVQNYDSIPSSTPDRWICLLTTGSLYSLIYHACHFLALVFF